MNVVVLDDELVALAFLGSLVSRMAGATPVEFADPREALRWCAGNEVDAVLVDYRMPDIDGIAFATALRALPGKAEIPILMITATQKTHVRHRALNEGINDFVVKPFDRIELSARLRNMLALRTSHKLLEQRAQALAEQAASSARAAVRMTACERENLMILSLAAEQRQHGTHEQALRVTLYAQLIGKKIGLDTDALETLRLAAPLHDVGELRVPDHILRKRGILTAAERDVMQQHTVIGAEILNQSQSPILRAAADIALSHHERWDGSGYPNGLAGDAIPLGARIVAVAATFDALTSARPYRPAWELPRALSMMKDAAGNGLAPDCTGAFFGVMDDVLEVRARHADSAAAEPRVAA